ncbi:WAP four-disulfide core domain protein 1 [Mactra antiquata]
MRIFLLILVIQTIVTVYGSLISRDFSSESKTRNRRKGKNSRNDRKESDNRNDESREKWMIDSIFYDDYQSDAPMEIPDTYDVCPPVPEVTSDDACAHEKCQRDTDCKDGYRCCYNGCVFTCLQEIPPAPLVDWRVEPRRSRTGVSWLIQEPGSSTTEVEICSTSPVDDDEDPLLCPTGYFCHVTFDGDTKHGIPNTGYCVRETENTYSPGEEDLVLTSALRQRQVCQVENMILLEGARIVLKDKSCRCRKGLLSCKKRSKRVKAKKKSKKDKSERQRKRKKNKDKNTSS